MGPPHAAHDQRLRLRAARIRAGLAIGAGYRSALDNVDGDVAELPVEEAVIGAAAELAIGHEAKSELLLQRDGIANSGILDRGQLGACDLALREGGARVEQGLWAQQAPDMLGAEWRLGARRRPSRCALQRGFLRRHGVPPMLSCRRQCGLALVRAV